MKYLSLPKTLMPGNCFVHIRSKLALFKKKKDEEYECLFSFPFDFAKRSKIYVGHLLLYSPR